MDFTHTVNNPLKIQLDCGEGSIISVISVLKARREESYANINWCNAAEFSVSDCIHYEDHLTQTLKSVCNTKPLCASSFISAANVECQMSAATGYYEINYIHVEYKCVRSK